MSAKHESYLQEIASIHALVRHWADKQPGRMVLHAPGRKPAPWSELWAQMTTVGEALRELGLTRSSRIAVVLPDGPELAAVFLSVSAYAGFAPLNPAYKADEFDFYLADLNANALIINAEEESPARAVARKRGIPILEFTSDPLGPCGWFEFQSDLPWLETSSSPIPDPLPTDTALLLHTSGTTSRPKLVPLSHGNLCSSARHIATTLELSPADKSLVVMPLFHIHGLIGSLLSALWAGGSVMCTAGFSVANFFRGLAEFKPTWFSAVPTMHQAILTHAHEHAAIVAENTLRFIRSSSAALPPQVMKGMEMAFGVPMIESYGMTEASHQMTSNPLPPGVRKPGSVGRAAGPEVAVIGESGRPAPAGERGQIVIRGPNVMEGYVANPAANSVSFEGSWFKTGDQGYLDEEGYLFITGRLKEIINRGGEKVAPREIDEVLMSCPGVHLAVAFAVPHPTLGEDIAAAVVPGVGHALDEAQVRAFVAQQLPPFKVPTRIIFVSEIPKGPTGKVQRIGLAERLAHSLAVEYEPPVGKTEERVAGIFAKVLRRERIGRLDNFFAAGGDSIRAMQAAASLRESLRMEVPPTLIFQFPTAMLLAPELERRAADQDTSVLAAELERLSDDELEKLLIEVTDRSGHAVIAEQLARGGIQRVYGIAGTPVDQTFAECARCSIRLISAANQQAAVLMAAADNYVTGRLQAAVLVSAGPATTNAVTGALVATDNGWPVIILGGRRPLDKEGSGHFQELDAVPIFAPVTRMAATVKSTSEIEASLLRAFCSATGAPRGAVFLDLPEDVLDGRAVPQDQPKPPGANLPPPDPAAIQSAADLLVNAKRPLLILGEGIRWSYDPRALRRLVECGGLPFISTSLARGYLPDDHELCGNDVRRWCLGQADVVVLAGAWFDWRLRFGAELAEGVRVIHVHDDPAKVGKNIAAEVSSVAEPGTFLTQLSEVVVRSPSAGHSPDSSWCKAIAQARRDARASTPRAMNARPGKLLPSELYQVLHDLIPTDAIVAVEGNICLAAAQKALCVREPASWLDPGYNGLIGGAIPFALGAKLAQPERPVVALCSDTGFLMSAMNLEAATRHHLPIVVIVANNEGNSGSTRQRKYFPPDSQEPFAQFLPGLHYERIAQVFGGYGEKITELSQIVPGFKRALAAGVPACLNVQLHSEAEHPGAW